MIKLKNILSESKVGYLVEKEEKFKAKSTKSDRVIVYKSKDAMDKAIKAGRAEPLDKKTKKKDTKPVFKKDDKPRTKKDQEKAEKAADKKEKKELEKIKNSTITIRKPGKADKEIAIKDI